MTKDIPGREVTERNPVNVGKKPFGVHEAGSDPAWQVRLGPVAGDRHSAAFAQTSQEHLHLHGGGVLRLVQHHEGAGKSPPPHEGKWRDLDSLVLDQSGQLLVWQEVIECIIKRLHVRIDLVLHVARKETKSLAGPRPRVDLE